MPENFYDDKTNWAQKTRYMFIDKTVLKMQYTYAKTVPVNACQKKTIYKKKAAHSQAHDCSRIGSAHRYLLLPVGIYKIDWR